MNIKYIFTLIILLSTTHQISAIKEYDLTTSKGNIHVHDTGGEGLPVLMIHGNSASGKMFKKQLESETLKPYRLIAVDLPGHGQSAPANSEETYSFPGYADALSETVTQLNLNKLAVVGWSLGGHIALEMLKRSPHIQGTLITGTPPIELSPEGMGKGFKPFDGLELLGHEEKFTKEEAERFIGLGGFENGEETAFIVEDARQTLGAARKNMIKALVEGKGDNEVEIVRSMQTPLAIIAGTEDEGINTEYIKSLEYSSLWKNNVQEVSEAGHPVFWQQPTIFNELLNEFLTDISKTQ